ncbi:MAG: YbaB/EbfC family nucleoid-associated protein [Deltaproteobacteria bacterium]|nr:YbaB/EbfC family nucleoid-associated protein [Deltaproteobacteria bacterium]
MAGFDMQQLFAQAQAMQEQMKKAQEQLATQEVSGAAGGGLVTARVTGTGELIGVKIDSAVVTKDDIAMLEDLVTAAVNDALRNQKQLAQQQMTGSLGSLSGLPGMPR